MPSSPSSNLRHDLRVERVEFVHPLDAFGPEPRPLSSRFVARCSCGWHGRLHVNERMGDYSAEGHRIEHRPRIGSATTTRRGIF